MRSLARATWLAMLAAWCIGTVAVLMLPLTAVAALSETEILDALDEVRADPNISPKRTIRTLKWAGDDALRTDDDERNRTPGWLTWVEGLFQWIGGASRLVMWIVILFLLGMLGLFLKRILSGGGPTSIQAEPVQAPTHVREMDIRPESLPDDIGGAALALWERNDHRAALALLYRGLLSRLVHSHGVPIRESSTEADCLSLAKPHLQAETAEYAAWLVRVWQHAVYGGRAPTDEDVKALCSRFALSFPSPVPAAATQS